MIIEGTTHDNACHLARYLLKAKEGEKEFLYELRDAASDNIREAMTDWEACGRALTKGEKILYHTHIRLRDGEVLNDAQWMATVQRLEEGLGLTNCPRAVVGHNNERGLHLHVVWSRLDPVAEILAPLSYDRKQFHAVARWAEKEYGLEPPKPANLRKPGNRKANDRERRALKDRGIDKDNLAKIVRAAWRTTESGAELQAMLASLGVEIKPGDRRDYVVEYKGLKMNPVRLLEDVRTAEFRERMIDAPHLRNRETSRLPVARLAKDIVAAQVEKELRKKPGIPPAEAIRAIKKPKEPQPRFRRKLWFGDPGI